MPTVLISGANRGLGLEFVRQYLADNWRVIALCRKADQARELAALRPQSESFRIVEADVTDFAAIDELAHRLQGQSIDVLINNAGLFGPKPKAENDLRQNFGHIDPQVFTDVYQVNALAPLKMAEAFREHVLASEQKKFVTISSAVGSIAETEGGIYAYRMSKAAVNMAMANLACEITPEGAIVAVLNPGWVKTDMGGPDALIELSDSIRRVRAVIDGLTTDNSGSFIDYDGRIIPW